MADQGKVNAGLGTVDLLNAGFAVAGLRAPPGSDPFVEPQVIAVFLEVPADLCDQDLPLALELIDQDGRAVDLATPDGPEPVAISQTVRVGAPAGAPAGTPGSGNLLVELGPPGLPLRPGGRYRWRVTFAGATDPQWEAGFWVPRVETRPASDEEGLL